MNPAQMGYTTSPYGPYHSLAAQRGGMGGAMMAPQMALMGSQQNCMMGPQQNGIMGAQGVMGQASGVPPTSYMAGMPQGMMGGQPQGMLGGQPNGMMGGQPNGMMGQQQNGMMGSATAGPQQVYGAQQAQQLQWNITQVCVCVSVCVRGELFSYS